jgi:two-component system sensor histidine kinase KdpD
VIDHGPGVPEDQRELIFEPFQRLDERSGGVGLGLSVARGFTEAMGGTIEASGTPHGGLTMRLTLLAASSDVSARLEAAP